MEITVAEAAERLGVSRQRVTSMLRAHEIAGRRISERVWAVDLDSVLDRDRTGAAPGRPWKDATVREVVLMLSDGGRGSENAASLIRRHDTAELMRRIARTVTIDRFSARRPDAVTRHLALTGESAISTLGVALVGEPHMLHGYLRGVSLEEIEEPARLVPSSTGEFAIHAFRTGPAAWIRGHEAPRALVAVDCGRSAATRVRRIGLDALDEMRRSWLAKNT